MEALENNSTEKDATLEELIGKMKDIANGICDDTNKNEAANIKKQFYLTLNEGRFNQTSDDDENIDFNSLENDFKNLFNTYHEKRSKFLEEKSKNELDNLNKRKNIIERIKSFVEDAEKIHEHFNEFKNLQKEWKTIGNIPVSDKTEIFREYNKTSEQFYDLLKINIELREYDFKKNLEIKTALCEKAEALCNEDNVINALKSLQNLHEQWTQAGPVAKDLREQLWTRFKEASTLINKKHNAFFEERKQKETEALKIKEDICNKVEAIDPTNANKPSDWDKLANDIKQLQKDWKTAGFTPAKTSEAVYDRYRAACNKFFDLKKEFFNKIDEGRKANKTLKQQLIDKANELKDSSDWKATATALIDIQKKWKEIGAVPARDSQPMWKEFTSACDAFFAKRKDAYKSQKDEENENFDKKNGIIDKIEELTSSKEKEAADTVKSLIAEFNAIGHVPFDKKNNLFSRFNTAIDKAFEALNIDDENRPVDTAKLNRLANKLKTDIKTAENNIMFLSPSNSKKPNPILDEMKNNIEKMKKDLLNIEKKIESNSQAKKEQKA